jgi:hypothetical protein
MLLRPWLLYYRRRLLIAALFAFAAPLITLFATSADSGNPFGVLWNTACTCPPTPGDLIGITGLFSILALAIGYTLGTGYGAATTGAAVGRGDTPYFFTRPIPRTTLLFSPLLLATAAILLLPAFSTLLLLGWLNLVHAPALSHLHVILDQIPAVAVLGPNPSLLAFFNATAFLPRLLAGLSIGLCGYAITASQRWFSLSPNPWLKFLGALAPTIPALFFPLTRFFGKRSFAGLLLTPTASTPFYVPSILSITLHYAFVAAIFLTCFRTLQQADL